MSRVVVFGTGEIGDVVAYSLGLDSPHEVVAFSQDGSFITETEHRGLPIVPFEDIVERYPPDDFQVIVAVSFREVNELRAERFAQAKAAGYRFVTYVSSRAIVWPDLEIGQNSIVMEGSVIQPFVRIGDDVIVGPSNCIGHNVSVADHCFLASHVTVSGHVSVGEYTFLGAGSTIRDGVAIGAHGVVGAQAVILHDTEPRQVYASPRPQLLPFGSDKIPKI